MLATSLDRGRRGLCCFPQRRATVLLPLVRGKSNFAFEKSQRLFRRSLRAKALGFVRSALLHYQNFVSLALAQDDVLKESSQNGYSFSSKLQFFERVRKTLCVVTRGAVQHNLRGSNWFSTNKMSIARSVIKRFLPTFSSKK